MNHIIYGSKKERKREKETRTDRQTDRDREIHITKKKIYTILKLHVLSLYKGNYNNTAYYPIKVIDRQ